MFAPLIQILTENVLMLSVIIAPSVYQTTQTNEAMIANAMLDGLVTEIFKAPVMLSRMALTRQRVVKMLMNVLTTYMIALFRENSA
jgi:hypothetical protein